MRAGGFVRADRGRTLALGARDRGKDSVEHSAQRGNEYELAFVTQWMQTQQDLVEIIQAIGDVRHEGKKWRTVPPGVDKCDGLLEEKPAGFGAL